MIHRHGGDDMTVDHPTTTLEELFLRIVQESELHPGRRKVAHDGAVRPPRRRASWREHGRNPDSVPMVKSGVKATLRPAWPHFEWQAAQATGRRREHVSVTPHLRFSTPRMTRRSEATRHRDDDLDVCIIVGRRSLREIEILRLTRSTVTDVRLVFSLPPLAQHRPGPRRRPLCRFQPRHCTDCRGSSSGATRLSPPATCSGGY